MKTNNLRKGFTLIELLVVIVIIGILATIGVATFSGYFKKARDSERQAFIRNANTMIKAAEASADTPDYRLGGATNAAVETAVEAELTNQGYSVPATKNSVAYYLILEDEAADGPSDDYVLFVCKEDKLGVTTGSSASDVAFIDGTTNGIALITETIAETACAATPVAPVVTDAEIITLSE